MRKRGTRLRTGAFCLGFLCLLLGLVVVAQAFAAEEPPYEFSAELSLTGGCKTSKADPIPDPGCPEKHPPEPFARPMGIAIDSFGDEYVASYGAEEKQGRIDVFSPKGVFITEIKDEFGPKAPAIDSKGVLYTFDQSRGHNGEFARYKPIEYKPAEGKIAYGPRELIAEKEGPGEGGIAIDSNDHVFVDWRLSIDEYSSAAEGNELLDTITNEKLLSSVFIALDKQRRRLYASSCPTGDIEKCWVIVLNADKPHELLEEVKGPEGPESAEIFASNKGWISVAVDEETGDFFVGDLELTKNVYQFTEKYEPVSTLKMDPNLFEGGQPLQIAISNAPEGTKNKHYLFVPSLVNPNRALAFSPPAEQPAKVKSISVAGIGETEAELLATLEPKGGEAHYVFEYTTQEAFEVEGFAGAKVAGAGMIQPAEQEAEVSAPISGLEPGVAYRFRVSIENGAGGETKEAGFTTYSDAPINNSCPNQELRVAYSTLLPDCRAYELVTPANTNGRPPTGQNTAGDIFSSSKAAPSGEVVSFLTQGGVIPGFGGTGSLNGDLYRTARTENGWKTASAGPTGEETTSANPGSTSSDQGYSFWQATQEGSAVIEGKTTSYVRYPDGHSELIGRGEVEGEERVDPRARGRLITENGTHIVFETNPVNGSEQPIQLEPNAPPTGTQAVYDRTADEVTHVVSLLPGDETPKAGEDAEYVGASADGEGIAFEITTGENAGKLYLRVNNAKTFELGEGLTFAGVSEEGKRIFYLKEGNLVAFDTEAEKEIPFTNTGNAIPVNVSADGTRAYFVSTTAIAEAGPNPNGAFAKKGQQNLYLSEEGTIRFVGTVTERDVVGAKNKNGVQVDGLGLWASAIAVGGGLALDPSRTTPDGSVLLFSSRANLDGYAHENVPELYRYDSVSERLHCVSCLPSETAASDGAELQSLASAEDLEAPLGVSGFVPNLRADGKRAFFQSTEALVSRDNDGVQDVYEWEEQGVGSCTRPGGCVYLISSGHSGKPNYLYGISQSGDDVFFTTSDVLTKGDDSTVSIYDARVNGGFPEAAEEECMGESCKPGLTATPPLPSPVTGSVGKFGNVMSPKHCPKGKHKATRKGKKVCVKNHHHKKHHAKKKGRAGK